MARQNKPNGVFALLSTYLRANVGKDVTVSDIEAAVGTSFSKMYDLYVARLYNVGYIDRDDNASSSKPNGVIRVLKQLPDPYSAADLIRDDRVAKGYLP